MTSIFFIFTKVTNLSIKISKSQETELKKESFSINMHQDVELLLSTGNVELMDKWE